MNDDQTESTDYESTNYESTKSESAMQNDRTSANQKNRASANESSRSSAHQSIRSASHQSNRASTNHSNRSSSHQSNRASANQSNRSSAHQSNRASANRDRTLSTQHSRAQLVAKKLKVGYNRDIPYKFQYCMCGLIKIATGSIIIAIIELIILCHSIIFAAVNTWGGSEKYELYNPVFANVIKYIYLPPFLAIQLIWLFSNILLLIGVKAHIHWLILPHVFIKIVSIISGMILVGLCISTLTDPQTETNWELLLSISVFTALIVIEVYFCLISWCCYKYIKLNRVKVKAQKELHKSGVKHLHNDSSDDDAIQSDANSIEKLKTANQVFAYQSEPYDFFDKKKFDQFSDVFVVKTDLTETKETNIDDDDKLDATAANSPPADVEIPNYVREITEIGKEQPGPVTRSKSARSTKSRRSLRLASSDKRLKSAIRPSKEGTQDTLSCGMKHVHFDDL